MERDLKIPAWDLPQLERNAAEANLSSLVGYSGSIGGGRHSGGLDLKLGGLGDFGLVDRWKEQRRGTAMAPPPAAAKRPRVPPGGFSQNVSCLVDGCRNDLSSCREYHRRHKVCEVHSKTPIVFVDGQEQRFCQQCSRFHSLVEFDEVKRSCRKRLDGHNRRRRKQQPDSMNSRNLFTTHHGTRFSSYPQIFPTTATGTTWTTISKSEGNVHYSQRSPPKSFIDGMQQMSPQLQHLRSSFTWNFKEGKQFPFVRDGDEMALCSRTAMKPTAVCQPHLKTISSAAESSSCKTMFSVELPRVLDSPCALSLLSTSAETSGISLGHMVPVDSIPIGQPLFSTLEYEAGIARSQAPSHNSWPVGFSSSGLDTVLVSDTSEADLHCHRNFHVGGEGPSEGGSQNLPFSWQ